MPEISLISGIFILTFTKFTLDLFSLLSYTLDMQKIRYDDTVKVAGHPAIPDGCIQGTCGSTINQDPNQMVRIWLGIDGTYVEVKATYIELVSEKVEVIPDEDQ